MNAHSLPNTTLNRSLFRKKWGEAAASVRMRRVDELLDDSLLIESQTKGTGRIRPDRWRDYKNGKSDG
jgi:hypothetical protein